MQKLICLAVAVMALLTVRAQGSNCPTCPGTDSVVWPLWPDTVTSGSHRIRAPYTPLSLQGDTLISLSGRRIQINRQGFPEQIQTFGARAGGDNPKTTVASKAIDSSGVGGVEGVKGAAGNVDSMVNNLLAENIHFHVTRQSDGKDLRLKPEGLQFTERTPRVMRWTATGQSDELRMDVSATLEFHGYLAYRVKLTALRDLDLKEISMHIPFQKDIATYMAGLGLKGGRRPDSVYQWKWDVTHPEQDGAWIGTAGAGLQYALVAVSVGDNSGNAWNNEGKGGIAIGVKGKSMLAHNYSGARSMKTGDVLWYNFNLMITPLYQNNYQK